MQEWSNGKIATYGGSALGIVQNMQAPGAPAALATALRRKARVAATPSRSAPASRRTNHPRWRSTSCSRSSPDLVPSNSSGPALTINFAGGETIHTENSYKFTPAAVDSLLASARFKATQSWQDPQNLFAVTLATAL